MLFLLTSLRFDMFSLIIQQISFDIVAQQMLVSWSTIILLLSAAHE